MDAVDAFCKQEILALVRRKTISEEQFNYFNKNIEKKLAESLLAERILKAKEVGLQSELNQISKLYRTVITMHQANIKQQYDLGRDTLQQIEAAENLTKIMILRQLFEATIAPVLKHHKHLETEVQSLEREIKSLLPMDNRFL